jgi:putative addiction module component (TIGR02574 family)
MLERQRTMKRMATAADRVLDDALKLAPDERARIVAELLATLEPDVPGQQRSDEEWIREIERRARAALAGSPGVSWTDAREQIRSRLTTR